MLPFHQASDEHLSKENILKYVSEFEIFRKYIDPHLELSKLYCSPLRIDKHPSFNVFIARNRKLLYKDFATGETGDCFRFIQQLYGVNFIDALRIIDTDFNLGLSKQKIQIEKRTPMVVEMIPTTLSIIKILRSGTFTDVDLTYWAQYGLDIEDLHFYNVSVAKEVLVIKNGTSFKMYSGVDNPIYSYKFEEGIYKLYLPFSDSSRFITNAGNNIIQGVEQLTYTSDLLIITKSLKDVMALNKMGYEAIAFQSENTLPDLATIEAVAINYNEVIVFYDNDIPGKEAAAKASALLQCRSVEIPEYLISKDPTDLIKDYGYEEAFNKITKIIG